MPKVRVKLTPLITQCASLFRSRLWQAVVCYCILVLSPPLWAASIEDIEAVFIGQFTNYVEWPQAFHFKTNPDTPFIITVVGDCEILQKLKQVASSPAFKARKIVVRSVDTPEALTKSAIAFVCGDDSDVRDAVVKKTRGLGTLTFSHAEGFGEKGIMVNFYLDHEKLRFEINSAAVKREDLQISSQLLKLARIIE